MNTRAPAQHEKLDWFKSEGPNLLVNGIPLPQLAERVGQTPFYAYDRSLMTERVAYLRNKLPKQIQLHYAMKANPMPAVVQHMAGLVDGLDVASRGEMHIALDTGISPAEISFAGPGKSTDELRSAIAAEIVINVESPNELNTINQLGNELGIQPHTAIRVNPDFELKSSGMKMAGGPKQFGIDAEQVPEILSLMKAMDLCFEGFHIFSGSQNLRHEAIIEAHDNTFELAFRLSDAAPATPRFINIGGGFGIPYFPGETRLDIDPIAANLQPWLDKVTSRLGETQTVIELGRYLVGEAGIYVSKVVDKKISRSEIFLITNGGLHHHLSNSGNFGQVIRKNYPVLIGNKMDSGQQQVVNVVGPLCTPLDILANKMQLPEASIGDLVVILQSGAYGLTASPRGFLSHPNATEHFI